jgi:Arc/MetJ-type ribon-helix-helix transcriptional regulator
MSDDRTKRGRGRPPLYAVASEKVQLRLPADQYDRADRLARQGRESVQDVLRRGLQRLLNDERGGTI